MSRRPVAKGPKPAQNPPQRRPQVQPKNPPNTQLDDDQILAQCKAKETRNLQVIFTQTIRQLKQRLQKLNQQFTDLQQSIRLQNQEKKRGGRGGKKKGPAFNFQLYQPIDAEFNFPQIGNIQDQNMTYQQMLELGERIGKVCVGLSEDKIESLPVFPCPEEDDCTICLDVIPEQSPTKELPGCRHKFHPDCIDQWLKSKKNCPLCLTEISL